jgi:hypothetical protein
MYQSPAKLGDKISPYLFIQWKLVIPVMAYIFTIVIRYMFTIFHHAIATHTHIYNYGDSHFHHKITIYKYIFIMYIYIYFTIFHHLSHWSWLISSPQKARHFGLRSWCIAMSRKPWAMSAASALLWSWCRGSWGVFFFVGYIYINI